MRRLPISSLLLSLIGCASPRLAAPPPVTGAFDRPLETALGRSAAERAAGHAGDSGLYVLGRGLDAFAARVGLIDRAERTVDLQVYIFHDDVTGRLVLERLLAAADRGVRVRLLLDDLGSAGVDDVMAAADVHENLEVRFFNPFARGPSPGLARSLDFVAHPRRLNRRMHNKLLAVDGAGGIVGGRNVGDEYFDAREDVNFADLELLAFGPVVRELGASFDEYWNSRYAVPLAAWSRLLRGADDLARLRDELARHVEEHARSPYAERVRGSDIVAEAASGELELLWAPTHAVADLPRKIEARGDDVAETLLTERIRPHLPPARSELLIVSPYFVPRAEGSAQLVDMVARGVRVSVLTNSLAATDVPAVHAGYSRYRARLLAGGVELHELRPANLGLAQRRGDGLLGSSQASLHAKTFCFDRRRVFVGSLNLDPRSVDLNTEIGLVVESEELAARFVEAFERTTGTLSWRLALAPERNGRGTRIVWHGTDADGAVERYEDPGTSFWKRLAVDLLGFLPIEGQL